MTCISHATDLRPCAAAACGKKSNNTVQFYLFLSIEPQNQLHESICFQEKIAG
jgi:hypothetical protein